MATGKLLVVLAPVCFALFLADAWANEDWQTLLAVIEVELVMLVLLFVLLLIVACFAFLDVLCIRPTPPTAIALESFEMKQVNSRRVRFNMNNEMDAHSTPALRRQIDNFDLD